MEYTGNRRWWAAAALALSCMVIGIDATVLSLALPNLATDLHASNADLQWFVDAYLLVLGALMLPAGLLGDRFGRKKLLLAALTAFGIGSVCCAYAASSGQLIAARVLLGLASAFVFPLSLAVLPVIFKEEERQRALAVVASSMFAAYPIGPILGGWLLNNFWWGSVFLINVPVVVIALIAVSFLMPESRSAERPKLDVVGMLVSTAGLAVLTFGLIRAGEHGWLNPTAIACMVAGLLVTVGFVWWERHLVRFRSGQPLIDLDLFRSRGFRWGTILSTLLQFALVSVIFAAPQYFRAVLGTDAMGAGLRLLPLIGGMVVGLGAGDRVAKLAGTKITVGVGFAVAAGGLILATFTAPTDGTAFASTWLAITGLGTGLAMPAALNAAIGQLTGERSGVGSALVSAIRQTGGTFGVAVLGSVLSTAYHDRLDLDGLPAQASDAIRDNVAAGVAVARQLGAPELLTMVNRAFVHGMDVMLAVSGVAAAAAALLAFILLPGPRETGEAGAGADTDEASSAAGEEPSGVTPPDTARIDGGMSLDGV